VEKGEKGCAMVDAAGIAGSKNCIERERVLEIFNLRH
jgi:hypothetical protein